MSDRNRSLTTLKRLVWLYFWLLIFEGALRKWVVPQLSTPLLIIRDPVALLIYALAISRGIVPRSGLVIWTVVLAILCFVASLAGIGTLKVTLYGLRADFLHLPLIFFIPEIFDMQDAKAIGKWLLILSIPMTALVFLQFRASPGAWINAAAGGEREGQLYAAFGKIRPPGTFSFVTGMVSFITLVSAYLCYNFMAPKNYSRWLIAVATPALVLSVGVSGSRSAVVGVVIVAIVAIFVSLHQGKLAGEIVKYFVLFCVVSLAMDMVPAFREGLKVHEERFESGGGIHEGIVDRFLGELIRPMEACFDAPFLGLGLGLGTNAGAGIVSGERQFLLSEGEWGRVILESGPILGLAFLALRFAILGYMWNAAKRSLRAGEALPMLLLGAIGLDLVTGQFGQPTELGFVALTCGLCLVPVERESDGIAKTPEEDETIPESKKLRGRSAYAEALHGSSGK